MRRDGNIPFPSTETPANDGSVSFDARIMKDIVKIALSNFMHDVQNEEDLEKILVQNEYI